MSMDTPWRSVLYVPAHVDRFVEAAPRRGADCLLLDLEDSVPEAHKDAARERVRHGAAVLAAAGCEVAVRLNGGLDRLGADIEAAVQPAVSALFVPKVRGASQLQLVDEWVGVVERQRGLRAGQVRLVPIVESCAAFQVMGEIARASPRVLGLVLGSEDLAMEAGFEPDEQTLLMLKQQQVIAAVAAGVAPLGLVGSLTAFDRDREAWAQMVRRSRRFGFVGATCIHPDQVPVLNEAFTPGEEEVRWARRVVEADEAARREGRGAFALDGRMVDAPIVTRAQRLLQRAADLRARRSGLDRAVSMPLAAAEAVQAAPARPARFNGDDLLAWS